MWDLTSVLGGYQAKLGRGIEFSGRRAAGSVLQSGLGGPWVATPGQFPRWRFHNQRRDRVRAPIPNAGLQVGSDQRSGGPIIRDMMLPEAHRHASLSLIHI